MKEKYKTNAVTAALAVLALISGLALSASQVKATTIIVDENFNSYTVGSNIADQTDWSMSANGLGTIAEWPDNDLVMGNYLLTRPDPETSTTTAQATRTFTSQTGHIQISTDVFMAVHTGQFSVRNGNNAVGQIQFRLSPREIRVYDDDGFTAIATTFGYNRWYRISMDLYLDADTPSNGSYDVSVHNLTDDEHMGSITGVSLVNNFGAVDNMAFISTFSNIAEHGWDNVTVTVIPEPSTQTMLLGLASLVLLIGFKIRRQG